MAGYIRDWKRGTVYVLELAEGRRYCGWTQAPYKRLRDHFHGEGSVYSKTYPPVAVLATYKNCTVEDEHRITLENMRDHGIDAVRGGRYSNLTLRYDQIVEILTAIRELPELR